MRDNLEPAGEQLELPWEGPGPVAEVVETIVHRAQILAHGFTFYWWCACGRQGQPTTEGRAHGGALAHMRAVKKRVRHATP